MAHVNHGAMGLWDFSVWLSLALIVVGLFYLRGWVRLISKSAILELPFRPQRSPDAQFQPAVSSWRVASFLTGLFLIWAAVASPLAALDHELLTVHMAQHLLLMTLAPPLIWMGAPVLALSHGLPQRFVQSGVAPLIQWRPVKQLGKVLAEPALCWLAAAAALLGWHIPALFNLGLHSQAWHAVEQASFVASGLLFWWPVVQPWPSVSKWPDLSIILYLFLATLPCDLLSGFLVFCDRVVYPVYFSVTRPFGLSALEDQQCAGALMWTCVTVVYLIVGSILTTRLLSPQHSQAKLAGSDLCVLTVIETVHTRPPRKVGMF